MSNDFFKIDAQEDAWLFIKDKPNETTFLENPIKCFLKEH